MNLYPHGQTLSPRIGTVPHRSSAPYWPYTDVNKYVNHKCTTQGPDNQLSYTKMRRETFRSIAKREIDRSKTTPTRGARRSGLRRTKRSKSLRNTASSRITPEALQVVESGDLSPSDMSALEKTDIAVPASSAVRCSQCRRHFPA